MKARRHAALLDLMRTSRVSSQSEAATLLGEQGWNVTQATVSRDLDELGAVRVRDADGVRYTVLERPSGFGAPLAQVLREYVLSRESSGPLAVLRTPPGHANMVAAAIDREALDGVLGTVAGDDTVFVCGEDSVRGTGVLAVLRRIERNVAERPAARVEKVSR